jgi:hypothetical protein
MLPRDCPSTALLAKYSGAARFRTHSKVLPLIAVLSDIVLMPVGLAMDMFMIRYTVVSYLSKLIYTILRLNILLLSAI